MAGQRVTVNTNHGPIKVTARDVEMYITGLAQTRTKPSSDPYTDYSTGTARTLNQSQLKAAMSKLGYSKRQISNVVAGNIGGGGWLSDALEGLAGGLAAVGPETAGLGDALDAVLPGAGEAAPLAEGATEAGGAAAGGGVLGGLTAKALQDVLSKYGGQVIWLPIVAWISSGKNWVRVLEFVGGAVMIGIAMRELANS